MHRKLLAVDMDRGRRHCRRAPLEQILTPEPSAASSRRPAVYASCNPQSTRFLAHSPDGGTSMRTTTTILLTAVSLVVAPPALAHHGVSGEYDPDKPVTLTGTVTKIEWVNPHSRIYLDVSGPDGKATNWTVELAARVLLERMGWNGRSLKVGEKVTIR